MQSRYGRFKPFAKPRKTLKAAYGLCELRVKELIFGNVHLISGSQKNVVYGSQASVIQLNPDALANRSSGNNRTVQAHRHALEPLH